MLQQQLRTHEKTVPYDAVMRISRVDDVKLQKGLVRDVLDGKPNREIRAKIDEAEGKKAPVSKSSVKVMLLQALGSLGQGGGHGRS